MVLGIEVPLAKGREVKGLLKRQQNYEDSYLPGKSGGKIIFPIRKRSGLNEVRRLTKEITVSEFDLRKNTRTRSFRRELQKIVPRELYETASRAYEQVGDIGIITVFPHLEKYEKRIAKALMETNKGIRLVVKKIGRHEGGKRMLEFRRIAGDGSTETIHKESDALMKLDITKVYFSARTANERMRIANQVRKGEKVLVLFSGCGPFAFVIAKNAAPAHIVGIEINPDAHAYAIESNGLNNTQIEFIQGDARAVLPKLKERFDRIIMPHPTEADYFLNDAMRVAKKGTIIHMYLFSKEEKLYIPKGKIVAAAKKRGFHAQIEVHKLVRTASDVYKFCFDIVLR